MSSEPLRYPPPEPSPAISYARPATSIPDFIRCHDPAILNALLNHPEIRPSMGGHGILDGAPLLENGIFYLCDKGGMLFHGEDGLREGHYLFLPRSDPFQEALGMVHACVLEAGHRMLWGRVPIANRAARLFTRRLGFHCLGLRAAPFDAMIYVWGRT